MQRAFFDHYLLGKESDLKNWPTVLYEAREAYYQGEEIAAKEWPIEGTKYQTLYLGDGTLEAEPTLPTTKSYDSTNGDNVTFDHTFSKATTLVGHMALRLWVSIEEGDDMDIFVAIQKLDADGNIVPFAFYAQFEDGPVALGWLRASHRELDEEASTPFMPVHKHQRALKLTPGEIVPVDIEIWPSGTKFEAGESLRVVIQGSDIYDYPKPSVYARHESLRNVGRQTIHVGGEHNSNLLIPVLPD